MDTVTVETSELVGPALDWAVAKCEGWEDDRYMRSPYIRKNVHGRVIGIQVPIHREYRWFNPSTDWSQGGPIIEREMSKVFRNVGGTWSAMILKDVPLTPEEQGTSLALSRREQWNGSGPTPLIAAMRCYVTSKLGGTVQLPKEMAP